MFTVTMLSSKLLRSLLATVAAGTQNVYSDDTQDEDDSSDAIIVTPIQQWKQASEMSGASPG